MNWNKALDLGSSLSWISVKPNSTPDFCGDHNHFGLAGWTLNIPEHIRRTGQQFQFHVVSFRTKDLSVRVLLASARRSKLVVVGSHFLNLLSS